VLGGFGQVRNQTELQRCAFRRVPGLCDQWPAYIFDLPGDKAGGQRAQHYGTRLIDPAAPNVTRPADGATLLGERGNRTRLAIDAGGCAEGYAGRLCAACDGDGRYRALDGTCSPCPRWGNFITYLVWFGVWGAAAVGLVYAGTGRVHLHFMLLGAAQVQSGAANCPYLGGVGNIG
jgi:hypothetical protein